jgi:hypothetical protein
VPNPNDNIEIIARNTWSHKGMLLERKLPSILNSVFGNLIEKSPHAKNEPARGKIAAKPKLKSFKAE